MGSSHIIVYRRTFRISPRQLRRPVVIVPRNPLRKKEDTTKRIDVACTKRSAAFCIRGTGLGGGRERRYYTFWGVGVGPGAGHVTENDDVRGRPQRRMGKQCGGPCENGKIPRRGGEKNAGVSSFAQRVLPGRKRSTVSRPRPDRDEVVPAVRPPVQGHGVPRIARLGAALFERKSTSGPSPGCPPPPRRPGDDSPLSPNVPKSQSPPATRQTGSFSRSSPIRVTGFPHPRAI